jgi:subtilisin family serine protease
MLEKEVMRGFARSLQGGAVLALIGAASAAPAQQMEVNLLEDAIVVSRDPLVTAHPTRILVKFVEGTTDDARLEAVEMVGGVSETQYTLVPGLEAIETSVGAEAALWILQGLPFIEYAEFDYLMQTTSTFPNDTSFGNMWGLHNVGQNIFGVNGVVDADIDAPEAWDQSTGSTSVVIAVIDTGTQYTHVDLSANMWINTDEIANNGIDDDGNGYIDDTRGWDCFSNDNDPNDTNGHGTHTAGTIGAVGNNGLGVTGVCWTCKIMPLRFIGGGGGPIADAIEAIQYAVNNGARISNNSWGSYQYVQSLADAISAAQSAGHLFVAGAGNDNNNNNNFPFYPASYGHTSVISVAATTNTDARWSFSNYGSFSVDLGAPGHDILSTWPGNQLAWLSGTSMATPHVAGVAGLLLAKNPTWTYTQIRDRIFQTVRPLASLNGLVATNGMLNAGAALAPLNQRPPRPPQPTCTNLGAGQVRVDWVDNAIDETRWLVQRQQRVGGVWTNTTTVAGNLPPNTTTFTNTPGTGTWRYRIRSRNAFGWSQFSMWRPINVP